MTDILNKVPQYVLLPVLIVVAVVVVVVMLRAFREGRSFKIWVFEIGQRPDQVKTDSKTSGALTRSTISKAVTEEPVTHQSEDLNSSPQTDVSDLDVFSADSIEVITKTDHSVIEKRRINGKNYVVKKTDARLCQPEALEQLIGKEFIGYDGAIEAVFATPLKVWVKDGYVWELHSYYDGISLLELIKKNDYVIQGDLLGRIFNVLIHAVSQIHEEGILHRDLNPSNVFMMHPRFLRGDKGSPRLLILDCSFCCRMDSNQVPVSTSGYTAPEQKQGLATYQSDLYSIAATAFFLANGFAPEPVVQERFKTGLQNIFAGSLRPPFQFTPRTEGILGIQKSVPKLIETLLEPDPANRPQNNWEILLDDSSLIIEFYEILGIFDMGELGWLITQEYDYRVVPNDGIKEFLNEAFSHDAIKAPSVVAHAKRLLQA